MVKRAAEKAAPQAPAEAHTLQKSRDKKKPGRPKGSKNQKKPDVVLKPELVRIQQALHTLLETVGSVLALR